MATRREVLAGGIGIASGAIAGRALAMDDAAPAWPPYSRTLAIDGASGVSLGFMEKGDPGMALLLT